MGPGAAGAADAEASGPGDPAAGSASGAAGGNASGGSGFSAAAGPAFEPDPGAAGAAPDRIPWRRLEDGVYVRLLGALADDGGVSTLLTRCEAGSATARDLGPRSGEALGKLVGREQAAAPESAAFVGGIIRALALLPAEEAVPLLVRLAAQRSGLTAGSMPLARAAVRALGTVPGELVPPALHRLASESPLAALRKAAYAELKRRLRTLSDAPEWTVDTFTLDGDSRVRLEIGRHHVAVLRIEPGGRVKVAYHDTRGRALAGKPTAASVDQDALRDVTELAAKLRAAVRAARTRLESAQKEQREIPTADWIEHYITHPVTGMLAKSLLWEVRDGDAWHLGLPRRVEGRWCLVTPDGERRVPEDDDILRVAAPVELPAAQARAWARLVARTKAEPVLRQIH